MHTRPGDWSIVIDAPQILAVALYLRDVTGLGPDVGPPAAHPAVPRQAQGGAAAARQWVRWWTEEVDRLPYRRDTVTGEPDAVPFANRFPELANVTRPYLTAAREWAGRHQVDEPRARGIGAELVPTRLVQARTAAAGLSRTPSFRLVLALVPVAGHYVERVGQSRVLMAQRLYADTDSYRTMLAAVIDELLVQGG